MRFNKKINRFINKLETAPRKNKLKMITMIFSTALILGMFLAFTVKNYQLSLLYKTAQEIKVQEKHRMDQRIRAIRNLPYGKKI